MDQQNSQQGSSPQQSPPPAAAPALQVSPRAVQEIRSIMERENKLNHILRVSVVGGGCSGLSYKLSFEEKVGGKDKIFEQPGGVKVSIDMKSLLFLKGTILDYTEGLEGRGFVFTNPNAKSACGCGSSFSA